MMTDRALRATYRVQLHSGFTFDDAAALAPYLAALGISHLYCSPFLQAGRGSAHGYDVLAHDRLNEELGGEAAYDRMCSALDAAGIGQIVDIVPNHMAISSPENAWWWDVLKNGPASRYAPFFDIDWDPPESKLRQMILMPVLGDHYGRVLDRGEIRVDASGDEPVVRYFDHVAPLSPPSVEKFLGDDIDAGAARVNADVDALHDLLESQNYRLSFWRTAMRELDYRRFFDINTLVGLRQEDPAVFDATHDLVLGLVRAGRLDGVRIDHIDGLREPAAYLERLRAAIGDAYLVVEKILEPGEAIPAAWPVEGTTGYDFLNRAMGIFVNPSSEGALTRTYTEFTGETADYETMVVEKKILIESEVLASDVERLTVLLSDICESTREYRDYTRHDLREALRATLAAFPVYRTYVAPGAEPDPSDVAYVEDALRRAGEHRDDLDPELLRFLGDVLLLRRPGEAETELALRFQQTSGPVMAKGVEDTTFYNYNRLIALNEVGGDPGSFGSSVEEWHAANVDAHARQPRAMLATSTHDTKRSEDVRARLCLLSEIPDEWAAAVARWSAINERHRTGDLPDRNAEYLLYQTLVGAWPLDTGRALQFVEKASKEAKAHTSWINPNPDYDRALRDFVTSALDDRVFRADLEDFVAPLIEPGRVNSLSQLLLKLTAPGVPDVYQGTELWDLSLVDPDNRRPVDYARRRALLEEIQSMSGTDVWARADEGAPKLLVLARTLGFRARNPEWFDDSASYRALDATGAKAGHVVAYARGDSAVTVVPRLVLGVAEGWDDTSIELPPGEWREVLLRGGGAGLRGGGSVRVGALLRDFPVALLARDA
jgi:(1->4)-alpha-D-glucan 1-alpha-D-glucosylmutase